ncbi:MAG: hypothetical protein CMN87_12145 [Stappia sp.]|uniref:DUF6148 family protein n=1 Tax=Stappia sp. TaxID=1870903 RepID=UPI000C4BBC5D|nr:DUF6148 family protein [Stappia sp.]MAB00113.1 hypothetical protein [Stappia sp.]MBM20752.1 hypothetical protein [Stappia sp.]|tara:strand:- start:1764 stop:1988 length:225 start_codon:yes stop_codon:yes gene_type:complete
MAGLTLEQAQERLNDWLEADAAVARSQSYTIGTRTLTRANAYQIRENIDFWTKQVERLSAVSSRGRRPRYIVGL